MFLKKMIIIITIMHGVRDAKMVTRQDLPKAAMIVQIVVETVFTLTE